MEKSWNSGYIHTGLLSADKNSSAENAVSAFLNWKVKYEKFELPYFCKGILSRNEDTTLCENILEKNGFGSALIELPPIVRPRSSRTHSKNNEVLEKMAAVDQLEKQIMKNSNLLKFEKNQRIKVQEDMCQKLHSDEACNKDGELFLKLCAEENLKECEDNVKKHYSAPVCEKKEKLCRQKSVPLTTKNFVIRNIELAASAMSKHPLTDEEKQRLEQILTDIDTCQSGKDTLQMNEEKAEKTNADDSPNLAEHNAFIFNENDKKRLTEIDFELKNCYSETQHLRTADMTLTDNFWKSLILDQMLKNIDEKLGNIRHEDKITNPELQDSEPY